MVARRTRSAVRTCRRCRAAIVCAVCVAVAMELSSYALVDLPRAIDTQLDRGDDEHDYKQEPGHGSRIAHAIVEETFFVDLHRDRQSGVGRSTMIGQDIHLGED